MSAGNLLLLAAALLPFSTTSESVVGVQSFGLPILCLAVLRMLPAAVTRAGKDVPRAVMSLILLGGAAVLWLTITCFWAPNVPASLSRALIHVLGYVLFVVVVVGAGGVHSTQVTLRTLMLSFVVSSCACAAYYLVNLLMVTASFGVDDVFVERYVGGLMSLPWGATNTIAGFLLVGLLLALVERSSFSPALLWGVVALHSTALIFTLTRNAIPLAVIAILLGARKSELRWVLTAVGAAVLAGLLISGQEFAPGAQALYDDRIAAASDPTSGRLDSWIEKIEYMVKNPLGFTGFYSSIYLFGLSAHNFLLNVMVEQGLIGGVLSAAFLFALAVLPCRARVQPPGSRGLLSYRVAWLLIAANLSFEDANFTQQYIIIFWVFVTCHALSYCIARSKLATQRIDARPLARRLRYGKWPQPQPKPRP